MKGKIKYYVYNKISGVVVADNFKTKEEAYNFIYDIEYNERKFYSIKAYFEEE